VPGLASVDVSGVAPTNLTGMRGTVAGTAVFDSFACGTLSG